MTEVARFQIVDDDGAFVLSTRASLRALCPAEFDYAFPGVLLDGLRSGRLAMWQVPMESVSEFVIDRSTTRPAGAPMYIEVPAGDACLVAPWSQITMAFDGNHGEVENLPGLVGVFHAEPGWYEVYVQAPAEADPLSGAELTWSVTLVPLPEPPASESLVSLSIPMLGDE